MHNLHAQTSPDAELLGRDPPHHGRNTPVAAQARIVPPSTQAAAGVGNASAGRAGATTERADQRHAVRLRANDGNPQPSRPEVRPLQPPAARPPAAAAPRLPGPLRRTARAPAASPKTRTAAPAFGRPGEADPPPFAPTGHSGTTHESTRQHAMPDTARRRSPDQPDAGTPRRDPRAKPHDSRIPESTP
jgi:hypothetical protein